MYDYEDELEEIDRQECLAAFEDSHILFATKCFLDYVFELKATGKLYE